MLIENEVVPRFYEHNDEGVPPRWLEMVRHTLKSLGPKVLATRQVRDYVRELYAPAAHTARALNSDYAGARNLSGWKQTVRAAWPAVRVEHVESEGVGDQAEVGATLAVRTWVALGSLSPQDVEVIIGSSTGAISGMTPNEFIAKWRGGGKERAEAQSFFNDLCSLVGHPTPREADPTRTWFAFEYGAEKTVGGKGYGGFVLAFVR